jgi:hypothetical protein
MKLIIHIGTEKTASTSLQYFFDANRQVLTKHGVYFCSSLGRRNHRKLVAACMDHSKTDMWINERDLGSSKKRTKFANRVKMDFAEEMSQLPDGVETVLISSEQFHSRLTMESEIVFLREFLEGYFDSIDIVVFLRRQSSVLQSKYTTYLQAGGRKSFRQYFQMEKDLNISYYNYAKFLSLWRLGFGGADIKIREFSRSRFYGGHVCYDFLNSIDATLPLSGFTLPEEQNRSLNRVGVSLLRLLNSFLSAKNVDGSENKKYSSIKLWILEQCRGDRLGLLTESNARKFDQRFESSNREVEKQFGVRLFDVGNGF